MDDQIKTARDFKAPGRSVQHQELLETLDAYRSGRVPMTREMIEARIKEFYKQQHGVWGPDEELASDPG